MDRIEIFRKNLIRAIAEKKAGNPKFKEKDIAEACGISPGHFSDFKKGRKPLSDKNRVAIAKYLGIPYSKMCGETTAHAPPSPVQDKADEMINVVKQLIIITNEIRRELRIQNAGLSPIEKEEADPFANHKEIKSRYRNLERHLKIVVGR